jgi:NADPH:quinone reductase-like Zn-dependent oxidoreductase
MRAAVLHEYGVPRAGEFEEPRAGPGQAVVEVLAAGLNPVDVSICAGRFYGGRPALPVVAGREGVGLLDGARVYFDAPIAPFGSMAERSLIERLSAYPVPQALDTGVAVALGIAGLAAWLALTWRAQLQSGEHVLILGASGVVGQIAIQAARLLGAGRVLAAARSATGLERCTALGADAVVNLQEQDLAGAMMARSEGRIDVVLDPLFGAPLTAAVEAASFGARLVQLGAAAAPQATLSSASIRGKMLVIMGHSNFAAPADVKRMAYERMAEAAARGELRVEVQEIPLAHVAAAWERLAEGAHQKIVLVP